MLILFVEDRADSFHGREKSWRGLAVALSVVELGQSDCVLVGVSETAAIEIVLQVALD